MKLIVAIVKDTDALAVTDALVAEEFGVTRVASTGGFLRRGNVTLLIGVEPEAVERVFEVIEESCHTPEPEQHKATVFVLPAEEFTRLG